MAEMFHRVVSFETGTESHTTTQEGNLTSTQTEADSTSQSQAKDTDNKGRSGSAGRKGSSQRPNELEADSKAPRKGSSQQKQSASEPREAEERKSGQLCESSVQAKKVVPVTKKQFRKSQKKLLRLNYKQLKPYNLHFLALWTCTQNFRVWNQVRDEQLHIRSSNFRELTKDAIILIDHCELYIGDIVSGEKHGNGTIVDFASNLVYVGKFIYNQRVGKFHVQSVDGSYQFTGFFDKDMKNGQGNIVASKFQYMGNFKNDLFEGQGTLLAEDKTVYDGEFLAGKIHGMGKMKRENGDCYVGEFSRGLMHGNGQYVSNGGKVIYNGRFRDNLKCGEGEMQIDNERYEGEFENDLFNGQGRYFHANESVYIGPFLEGKLSVTEPV